MTMHDFALSVYGRIGRAAVGFLLICVSGFASMWTIEAVDTSGAGKFSSMKIDRQGNVHLAYSIEDGNRNPLKYAYWDHALKRWFVMQIAEGAAACSLTLDSKERPRISWADFGTSSGAKLRYAFWDGAVWKKQALPLNSDVIAYYNSIVLDASDNPTISFYEYRGAKDSDVHIRLRTVAFNGQVWEVKTVDGQEGSGKFNSMATDGKGHIYLAYANVSAGTTGLRFAEWDGTAWKLDVVDDMARNNGDIVGYSVAIALDKANNPHVTYMNQSSSILKYAVRLNGKWIVQSITSVAGVGYPDRNSIAISEDGRPFIGYYDAGKGQLKVAYRQGAAWVVETPDGGGGGFTSSIQIHGHELWISYSDSSNGALKVAHTALPGEQPKPLEASRPQ